MFIGFNLQLDENADIFCKEHDLKQWQKFGRNHLNAQKAKYKESLKEYVNQTEMDGTKIQNEWFPQINADIFISHSHKDQDLACALAGWMNQTFHLNCFIDSNVWGYSAKLLKEMHDKLSNKRESKDGGYSYDYESGNRVSQHVNTMLSIALQKMIDKVEAVIFLNTHNAVKVYTDTQMEKTYSPWIYSEIVCTQIVRKKPLLAYRDYKVRKRKYFEFFEGAQLAMHLAVSYTVSLKHLRPLSEDDLLCWQREYESEKPPYNYALDALYEFMCPEEVENTKNLFVHLQEQDIEALKKAYSTQDMNSEEVDGAQSAWNGIIDGYWHRCPGCQRCRYVLHD